EPGLGVNRLGVIDRSEHQPAVGHRQVPVTGDEHGSAGGPDVVGRHPYPVGLAGRPETGAPGACASLAGPVARSPGRVPARPGRDSRLDGGGGRYVAWGDAAAWPAFGAWPVAAGIQEPGTHWLPPLTACQ